LPILSAMFTTMPAWVAMLSAHRAGHCHYRHYPFQHGRG
jgi:hypothetical protein